LDRRRLQVKVHLLLGLRQVSNIHNSECQEGN
jgi:hypothetical protein